VRRGHRVGAVGRRIQGVILHGTVRITNRNGMQQRNTNEAGGEHQNDESAWSETNSSLGREVVKEQGMHSGSGSSRAASTEMVRRMEWKARTCPLLRKRDGWDRIHSLRTPGSVVENRAGSRVACCCRRKVLAIEDCLGKRRSVSRIQTRFDTRRALSSE
jgi:hypothetical protein